MIRYGGAQVYTWENGDTYSGHLVAGGREGWGVVTSPAGGLEMMSGVWGAGGLEGVGRVVRGTVVTETWFRGGCQHGLTRRVEVKKFRQFVQEVSWLGRYRSGVAWGQCWEAVEGGGWITGQVDRGGELTGDNIAFLYPDLTTAILGTFQRGVLVSGVPGRITGLVMVEDIAVPQISILSQSDMVTFSLSTEDSVGPQPLIRDPYEARTVEVRPSQVGGGGEGLFLRRNVKKNEVVAFYNGVRLPPRHGRKESWEDSGYKIFTNTEEVWGERMDLPGDLINTENYRATLGHKINHNFEYNCTEWFFQHPRHGLIPCITAVRDIEEGQELFLHYGYDPRNCPPWYQELLAHFMSINPDLQLEQAADPKRLVGKCQLRNFKIKYTFRKNSRNLLGNVWWTSNSNVQSSKLKSAMLCDVEMTGEGSIWW